MLSFLRTFGLLCGLTLSACATTPPPAPPELTAGSRLEVYEVHRLLKARYGLTFAEPFNRMDTNFMDQLAEELWEELPPQAWEGEASLEIHQAQLIVFAPDWVHAQLTLALARRRRNAGVEPSHRLR